LPSALKENLQEFKEKLASNEEKRNKAKFDQFQNNESLS